MHARAAGANGILEVMRVVQYSVQGIRVGADRVFDDREPAVVGGKKCDLRAGYPITVQPNQHFAGMFRIALNPPDFRDPVAVQRHLVLSETWADTVMREMSGKAGGLCGALILPYAFPDLRVSLIVYRTASRIDREKSVCTQALEDILQHSQPNDQLIEQAAKRNALFNQPSQPDPGAAALEPVSDAANILDAALPLIYERNSLLHALTSLGWRAFGTVDVQSQRSPERPY